MRAILQRRTPLFLLMALGAAWPFLNLLSAVKAHGDDEPQKEAHSAEADADEKHDEHEDADHAEHAGDAHEGEEKDPLEVHVSAEIQERIGLKLAEIVASMLQPEIRAIGVVEEDPSRSFTVRAPIAGYLQADAWPTLGAEISDHAALGAVQPRLTPLEQFALASQYVEARSAVGEVEAELAAAEASYESKRTLNADGKMVSDRQFEEAESKLKAAQARLQAAKQKLALLEEQHSAVEHGLAPLPLSADRGGRVIELMAAPGEAVESGQALLRVARFDRLLARIELPLGVTWDASNMEARISIAGDENRTVRAKAVTQATRAGAMTLGQSWLFALEQPDPAFRPGAPLIARLETKGATLQGVMIPSDALLRFGGLAWVFVHEEGEVFKRREVQLHSPTPEGWFVTDGVVAGEHVVVSGAQVLLSEQLKAQIEAEEEAGE